MLDDGTTIKLRVLVTRLKCWRPLNLDYLWTCVMQGILCLVDPHLHEAVFRYVQVSEEGEAVKQSSQVWRVGIQRSCKSKK